MKHIQKDYKVIEKLTDEGVDEMILETDVDDTQCSEQIVHVPGVLRLQKESWKLSQHSTGANPRTSRCTDRQHVRTHKVMEKIVKEILNLPQQIANAQDAKIVSRHDSAANWRTSCEQARPSSRKLGGGEAVRDHQKHRAEKESDRPAEDQSGEQAKGELDPEPAHLTS